MTREFNVITGRKKKLTGVNTSVDPEGGDRGSGPPPLENHKLYGFL